MACSTGSLVAQVARQSCPATRRDVFAAAIRHALLRRAPRRLTFMGLAPGLSSGDDQYLRKMGTALKGVGNPPVGKHLYHPPRCTKHGPLTGPAPDPASGLLQSPSSWSSLQRAQRILVGQDAGLRRCLEGAGGCG
eukprot:365346-Chlamydomonas_euryale.AAC.13